MFSEYLGLKVHRIAATANLVVLPGNYIPRAVPNGKRWNQQARLTTAHLTGCDGKKKLLLRGHKYVVCPINGQWTIVLLGLASGDIACRICQFVQGFELSLPT